MREDFSILACRLVNIYKNSKERIAHIFVMQQFTLNGLTSPEDKGTTLFRNVG
jgi:hypothetical protein